MTERTDIRKDDDPRATDPLLALRAETIDRLVNLDISGYGVIGALHEAARAHHGRPLALLAAEHLRQAISPGDHVFITTGWMLPGFYPYGETDGPVGAAALGRALGIGLRGRTVVLCEEEVGPQVTAACRAAGINVLSEADVRRAPREPHPNGLFCVVVPFPVDDDEAVAEAKRLFEKFLPKALISIEKNGPTRDGTYRMVHGPDNSDCVAKAGRLFEAASERGVLTIGIGDRGNEIGFGAIEEVPRRLLPFGREVTDTTTVDVLVTAAVSNWGAEAIAACLAALLDRPDVLHDADTESRMLRACVAAGGVDGMSCRPVPGADGMPEAVQVAINTLLAEIVRAPAATQPTLFSTPLYGGRSAG